MRRVRAGDGGFTLIELVVAIVVMGIIFVPLADFFVQYLDTANQTQQRLSDSHDLQITAAYFSQDVANTGLRNQTTFVLQQSVWLPTPTVPLSTTFCGQQIAGTPILLLKGDDESAVTTGSTTSGSDTLTSVEYVVRQVNAGTSLVRESCHQPPSPASPILDPEATIVHNLNGTPTVTCSSTCTGSTPPVRVLLAVSLLPSTPHDTPDPSTTLTGQRRQAAS